MSANSMDTFERQAAELIGVVKGLVKEFEERIGEAIHAQRVAASEARAEGVKVTTLLAELVRRANLTATQQKSLLEKIEHDWQLHIDDNAQRAGETQAKAFGIALTQGLQHEVNALGRQVKAITEYFAQATLLKWSGGIGLGIALTIWLGVQVLMPSAPGLSAEQVRAAVSRLIPCQIDREDHVCIAIDDKPRGAKGVNGEALLVVRGL